MSDVSSSTTYEHGTLFIDLNQFVYLIGKNEDKINFYGKITNTDWNISKIMHTKIASPNSKNVKRYHIKVCKEVKRITSLSALLAMHPKITIPLA